MKSTFIKSYKVELKHNNKPNKLFFNKKHIIAGSVTDKVY